MASTWTITLVFVNPLSSSPITTQSDVHDYAGVSEVVLDVAMGAGEIGRRLAPGRWIRSASRGVREIAWLATTTEEPHANSSIAPLSGINAAAVVVERLTRAIEWSTNTTTRIAIRGVQAFFLQSLARLLAVHVHLAAFRCVERELIAISGAID